MTAAPMDNMSRDSILQLLTGMGAQQADEPAPPCTVFDWRQSHYFNEEQMQTLQSALTDLTKAQALELERLCGAGFSVAVTGVTQHYASSLLDGFSTEEPSPLFQAFGTNPEEVQGVLVLTPENARIWVGLLMGASEGEAEGEAELSEFELSLLADITGTVIRAWSQLGEDFPFQPHGGGVCEGLRIPWDRAGHLCLLTCTVTRQGEGEDDEGQSSEVRYVLPCDILASLAEKRLVTQKATPEALSEAIMENLQEYPVAVKGEVGRTSLSFQELMQLREQDVVVLDRLVHEPIDMIVAGRPTFRAVLGRSQGHQALLITEIQEESGSVS